MKLTEIAARINAHLKRIEADPKLNPWDNGPGSTHPYYNAGAWEAGRYVGVKYVSYQGSHNFSKADAERYLAWLDAGNNGRHYEAFAARPAPAKETP